MRKQSVSPHGGRTNRDTSEHHGMVSDMSQKPALVPIKTELPKDARDRVQALADANYRSVSAELRRIILEHLERESA